MPKTKRRKKTKGGGSAAKVTAPEKVVSARAGGAWKQPVPASLQNVIFSVMVTLGFLGLAAFFIFFYSEDANHILYGAVAGLTGLGWLAVSARKWSAYRQRA